ncbi:MAG: hypothetical protein JW788_02835 [Candidatus Omnitrophica bacterium]|nr:hypothetical protein [Candidatus Omnitrophota bacterium]
MFKKLRVSILGDGRIARAAEYYLKKNGIAAESVFPLSKNRIVPSDLLIGALAGDSGQQCLGLALKYRKNLLDISDVDPPFYLRKKEEIEKKGILVIPGCGFSPGLVNFILGKELAVSGGAKEAEVSAGSLSRKKFLFPFLWCFEDLILEHKIPSWQVISGKNRKFPPFHSYRKERFFGIEAESYFCASGFENLLKDSKVSNFKCRVIRPRGFMDFFNFLDNHGFLKNGYKDTTKRVLEGYKIDNLTLAQIGISTDKERIIWKIKSFSRGGERLNSMQKITVGLPVVLAKMVLEGAFNKRGLLFAEDMGKDVSLFSALLPKIRKQGILLQRSVSTAR